MNLPTALMVNYGVSPVTSIPERLDFHIVPPLSANGTWEFPDGDTRTWNATLFSLHLPLLRGGEVGHKNHPSCQVLVVTEPAGSLTPHSRQA